MSNAPDPEQITIKLPATVAMLMRKRAAEISEGMEEPCSIEDLALKAVMEIWEPKPEGWDDQMPF